MKNIFIDTNLFLQCCELSEIKWKEIFTDDHLLLIIPRKVQEQLDHLKNDGNSRRARRARKACTLFRQMIQSQNFRWTILENNPHVELTFSPSSVLKQDDFKSLDLNRSDDSIVAEALSYSKSNSNTCVLSHDTGLILSTKRCDLEGVFIPDNWSLPPESDVRDKEISQLRNQIKEIQDKYPKLCFKYNALNEVEIKEYEPFTNDEIEKLVKIAELEFPLVEEVTKNPIDEGDRAKNVVDEYMLKYIPPTEEELTKYKQSEYPQWLKQIREYLNNLPKAMSEPLQYFIVQGELSNDGIVPAENLNVEFTITNELSFASPFDKNQYRKDRPCSLEFPIPPLAPKGKRMFDDFEEFRKLSQKLKDDRFVSIPALIHRDSKKDRNAFYWYPNAPICYEKKLTKICEEFRHKGDPKEFNFEIYAPRTINYNKAKVVTRVTAKNCPHPLIVAMEIGLKYVKINGFDMAKSILTNEIRKSKTVQSPSKYDFNV